MTGIRVTDGGRLLGAIPDVPGDEISGDAEKPVSKLSALTIVFALPIAFAKYDEGLLGDVVGVFAAQSDAGREINQYSSIPGVEPLPSGLIPRFLQRPQQGKTGIGQ